MKAHRETAVAAIAGAEKECQALRAEVERLKKAHAEAEEWIDQNLATVGNLEAENERLQTQIADLLNDIVGLNGTINTLRQASQIQVP